MMIPPLPKFPIPKIPPIDPKIIIEAAKYVWSIITGKDKKQDQIAQQKPINPQKSEANEIAELNKLLTEYRQNIISAGSNIEREMIVECSMHMEEIMTVFNEYNQSLKIARSEFIKRKFRRLNDDLKGTFADYISKKISLDDVDCVKTLKLPAGELKNQRLQELKEKVFIDATNAMIDKIKNTIDEFLEVIEDSICEHLDRTEATIEEKNAAFENLSKATDGDANYLESTILQSHYVLAICSYANEL